MVFVECILDRKKGFSWRRLGIEWPACLLVFSMLLAIAVLWVGVQSGLIVSAGGGGLLAGFLVTRQERTHAFRTAVSIAYGNRGPGPQFMRTVRIIEIGMVTILVVFLAHFIRGAAQTAHISKQLENTITSREFYFPRAAPQPRTEGRRPCPRGHDVAEITMQLHFLPAKDTSLYAILTVALATVAVARAEDWPTYQHDNRRSA